jgi:atypical dual specificity phosphatase
MAKIGNIYRWIYGRIKGRPTNFNWVIEGKLAGSGVPMSLRELRWLVKQQAIRSIVTIKEKPLPSEWFSGRNSNDVKIDYFHISVEDYGAPSLEELDYVVNYISRQIDNGKTVMVHCSGGKGRTGTILAAYLIKKERVDLTADQAIKRIRKLYGESIQSSSQEMILSKYERYLRSETREQHCNNNNNKDHV